MFKCKRAVFHTPNGENLSEVKVIIVDLSDEDGRQGFIQSCAIHVYSGADRKHKTGHALVHLVVFLQAFKSDGQCGRTERGQRERQGDRNRESEQKKNSKTKTKGKKSTQSPGNYSKLLNCCD